MASGGLVIPMGFCTDIIGHFLRAERAVKVGYCIFRSGNSWKHTQLGHYSGLWEPFVGLLPISVRRRGASGEQNICIPHPLLCTACVLAFSEYTLSAAPLFLSYKMIARLHSRCTRQVGFCGFEKHFSRFGFILLSGIFPARPLAGNANR